MTSSLMMIAAVLLAGVIFWLMIVVHAFRHSILWGLGCLLLWPVSYIYGGMNWRELRTPLIGMLATIVIGYFMAFSLNKDMGSFADASQIPQDGSFQDYLLSGDYKAFAYVIEEDGRWAEGHAVDMGSEQAAIDLAMSYCNESREKFDISSRCKLIAVGDIWGTAAGD